jgi:hypothetical protein
MGDLVLVQLLAVVCWGTQTGLGAVCDTRDDVPSFLYRVVVFIGFCLYHTMLGTLLIKIRQEY